MGLFSSLFGEKGKEADSVLDKMKQLADDLDSVKYADDDEKRLMNGQSSGSSASFSATFTEEEGPSGDSWGPVMPSEPNQYNSGLSYQDYFSQVFSEAFPQYQIDREQNSSGKRTLYTFSQSGVKKLVVEVTSCTSYSYKTYKDCRAQGIRHQRFYHDYDGWWNTKSYVIRRVSEELAK